MKCSAKRATLFDISNRDSIRDFGPLLPRNDDTTIGYLIFAIVNWKLSYYNELKKKVVRVYRMILHIIIHSENSIQLLLRTLLHLEKQNTQ